MSFQDDIKGQNTQLYPVVKIGEDYYSTNNVTIDGNYCKPILMNIPSIKESVDVESRKFKISNVSLQFNNFPFDGVRFSDQLSESSLINAEATIYFKSPSTTTIPDDENPLDTDLQEVYKGIIRRISHDDSKVSVELEDLTEQKAHKDLPQVSLGEGNEVPDKYKNKPIPMVYGRVEKSPLVVDDNYNKLIADSKPLNGTFTASSLFDDSSGQAIELDPLIVDDNGRVSHINQQNNFQSQYDFSENYFLYKSGNFAYAKSLAKIKCIISNDEEPTLNGLLNEDFLLAEYTDSVIPKIFDGSYNANNIGITGNRIMSGISSGYSTYNVKLLELKLDYSSMSTVLDGSIPDILGFKINNKNLIEYADGDIILSSGIIDDPYNDFPTDYSITDANSPHYNNITSLFGFSEYSANDYGIFADINPGAALQISLDRVGSSSTMLIAPQNNYIRFTKDKENRLFKISLNTKFRGYFQATVDPSTLETTDAIMEQTVELEGDLNEIELLLSSVPTDIFNKDFYANVNGRINTYDDHPDNPVDYIENPIDIIYDLVRSELGHDAINEDEYTEAKLAHLDWKFAFTVNKKISSKKLIQEIAKSTKCFPKFKNDGTFGFNTIKDNYDVDNDYAGATPIKESEVISYSFKKTKPEQIYKKVTVSYNKDYAQDSYLKTALSEDLGDDPYYGIEDSSDAHLEFESDYIRNKDTADDLVSFLSEQYKNDHLLFNLKLPLQYISLEIGDLVKFEDLFQDLTAYGIDYRRIEDPNGQYYYPLFMVTATTKNLDSVSIECMQLHNLDEDVSEWTEVEEEEEPEATEGEQTSILSEHYTAGAGFIEFLVDSNGELLFDYTLYDMFSPTSFIFVEQGVLSQTYKLTSHPDAYTFSLMPLTDGGGNFLEFSSFGGNLIITHLPQIETDLGDANLDGNINILDVVAIVNHILGVHMLDADELANADFNQEGNLNILDILGIINSILGNQ